MTLLADPPSVAPEPEAPALPTRVPRPSWFRGWRVPFRLARRDIARRPGRTVLVVLLMALPVAVMTLVDLHYRSGEVVDVGQYAFVRADATAYFSDGCTTACTPQGLLALLPPGSKVAWATYGQLPLRTPAMTESAWVTVAIADEGNTFDLREQPRGRWPAYDGEVVLDAPAARHLGVALGDTFRLAHQAREFTVVGVLSGDAGGVMVAPGFDFSVVRPESKSRVGFIDLPPGTDVSSLTMPAPETGVAIFPNATVSVAPRSELDQKLIFAWLAGVLGMSVLGVVIASAFAISGRRQLVMLGQLSASGAEQRTVTRTLGLLGTVTAAVGVVVGFAVAAVVHRNWRWLLFSEKNTVHFALFDMLVIAATAIAVATIAALAPTRSLARVSVLTALAGRRPVGAVPPGVVRSGAAMFVGGLLMTVIATRSGRNGGGNEAGMLAALSMICTVIGTCMLSPALVDVFAGLAARAGGSLRLAARGVARHRPRAAAVLASLLLLGMAATGVAALVEHDIARAAARSGADVAEQRNDVVWVHAQATFPFDPAKGAVDEPLTLPDAVTRKAAAERELGHVVWSPAAVAYDANFDQEMGLVSYLVATDDVLDLFGVSAQHRTLIAESDGGVQLSRSGEARWDESFVPVVAAPGLRMFSQLPFISEAAARAKGLTLVPNAYYFGRLDHDLTEAEGNALMRLGSSNYDANYYNDSGDYSVSVQWDLSQWPSSGYRLTPAQSRLIVLAVSLLLVTLVVAFGMALWAVEGRDERDVLVAVGASPSTMARVAGWRAGGLTFAAMVVAVPMGLFASWMISWAANGDIVVPWLLMALLIFAVPAVIGAGGWLGSAVAQRVRPVRMSTLTAD